MLRKAERLLDKILEIDLVTVNILMEANKLDMQVRWSINKAAILAFGHARDKSYVTLNKEGNEKRPAGPTKTIDLHSMLEKELNSMFIPATGERKRIRSALGK